MNDEDKQRNCELAEKLLSEQNFFSALVAGAVATLFAAIIYGIVTTLVAVSYGFMASFMGIAVGISMRFLGRGIDTKFAVAASIFTIASCFLGNLARPIIEKAIVQEQSIIDALRASDFSTLLDSATLYVGMVHYFFWLIAVWFAVFLAPRKLSRAERLALGTYKLRL